VDRNYGDLNEVQEEYLNDVLDSSRHLLSLINDILDLSKVEAGKQPLTLTDVHIQSLLENSVVMIREKAFKRGLKVSTALDGIPEIIRADERKIKQIMYNLLSNAVKFTPDGGSVAINAHNCSGDEGPETVAAMVDKGESSDGRCFIKIAVHDTGIGLKRKDLDRIFKTFEQGENIASRSYQGTGLGLSLTKSLVELHGGSIWAESKGLGKGSAFNIILPYNP